MIPTDYLTHDLPDVSRDRRDGVTIPVIWVAVMLSLLVHVAALWHLLPQLRLLPPEKSELSEITGPLTVLLASLPGPPPSLSLSPALRPAPEIRRPKPMRPRPAGPVIALSRPAPGSSVPTPAPPSVAGDMVSYIEARRRARGESSPATPQGTPSTTTPVEDDNARSNRIVAANLAGQGPKTFGYDASQGGGIFQIVRMSYDDAEFLFFGWDKDIRRKIKQMIEVRKGSNSDMQIAVVRRMIAIIREHEQGDFLWESRQLGRDVMLSARARDNAGLEGFMMNEFFPGAR